MKKIFLEFLSFTLLCITPLTGAESKRSDAEYSIRFTWWKSPEKTETYYILVGNNYTAINASVMSFTQPIKHKGESIISLSKKVYSKDNNGKPVTTYEPAMNINLDNAGSKDVGVILLPGSKPGVIFHQLLNLSEQEFPYGSFYIVNFSKTKIIASLNGLIIKTNPGQRAKSGTYKERTIIDLVVSGQNSEGSLTPITNSQIVLNNTFRNLFFVSEKETNGNKSFIVKTIIDSNPTPEESTQKTGDKKGETDSSKGKK
jgi:hypothetical protein